MFKYIFRHFHNPIGIGFAQYQILLYIFLRSPIGTWSDIWGNHLPKVLGLKIHIFHNEVG